MSELRLPQFGGTTIDHVTSRMYGVETRVEADFHPLTTGSTAVAVTLPKDPQRLAVAVSTTANNTGRVTLQPLTTNNTGATVGIHIPANGLWSVNVLEDLGLPAVGMIFIGIGGTVGTDGLYVVQTISIPRVLEGYET